MSLIPNFIYTFSHRRKTTSAAKTIELTYPWKKNDDVWLSVIYISLWNLFLRSTNEHTFQNYFSIWKAVLVVNVINIRRNAWFLKQIYQICCPKISRSFLNLCLYAKYWQAVERLRISQTVPNSFQVVVQIVAKQLCLSTFNTHSLSNQPNIRIEF